MLAYRERKVKRKILRRRKTIRYRQKFQKKISSWKKKPKFLHIILLGFPWVSKRMVLLLSTATSYAKNGARCFYFKLLLASPVIHFIIF